MNTSIYLSANKLSNGTNSLSRNNRSAHVLNYGNAMLSNANTSTHAPSSIGPSLWISRVYSHSFSSPLNLPFSSQLDIPENNQPNVVFFSRIFFSFSGAFLPLNLIALQKEQTSPQSQKYIVSNVSHVRSTLAIHC